MYSQSEILSSLAFVMKKAKDKLRRLTSRSRCGSIVQTMEKIKVYMRGWLNYCGIADMKNNIESLNGWLYRRIRMCIWKQWKLPKTRRRKLKGLGLPEWAACEGAYSRKSYWRMSNVSVTARQLLKPPCTERYARWCERTAVNHRLLLDFEKFFKI